MRVESSSASGSIAAGKGMKSAGGASAGVATIVASLVEEERKQRKQRHRAVAVPAAGVGVLG